MSNPTELPDVDYDKDMDRHYIPLPGGWEIQTKGKGSTFRIAHAGSGRRWMVLDDQLHDPLVVLANAVREALACRAQPGGEAPQADAPAPSAAAMDDVVDNLREYASNAGYSHNDYQDTMRQAANTIEALRAQLWHWGPNAAQQAAAPGALDAWFDAEQKRLDAVTAYNAAVLVSEREVWPGRDINPEYQAMNAAQNAEFHARGALFASRAAPSAPGTPEAPADQGAKDAARYRVLRNNVTPLAVARSMRIEFVDLGPDESIESRIDSLCDQFIAAQLDGGQEGSAT